jgi:hypothetical protein
MDVTTVNCEFYYCDEGKVLANIQSHFIKD